MMARLTSIVLNVERLVEKRCERRRLEGKGGLHPDFDLDNIPARVRGVGRCVEYVLPHDRDGRNPALNQLDRMGIP